METAIETLIDGKIFSWRAAGEFGWGDGPALCRFEQDRLLPGLGAKGYRIIDLPAGLSQQMAARAAALLEAVHREELAYYHLRVDDTKHWQTIEKTRELRFRDLDIPPSTITELFGRTLDVQLSETVAALGYDPVQLRINRPGSTDYNPPHRDGSLPFWANTLNVWIPIAGVNTQTSLPIVPGSHNIAESACWQTRPGGVAIGGRRYHVPAIARLHDGPLNMLRAPVEFGQALLFTPYLIHGLAANLSEHTRMALEFRLEVTEDDR